MEELYEAHYSKKMDSDSWYEYNDDDLDPDDYDDDFDLSEDEW